MSEHGAVQSNESNLRIHGRRSEFWFKPFALRSHQRNDQPKVLAAEIESREDVILPLDKKDGLCVGRSNTDQMVKVEDILKI